MPATPRRLRAKLGRSPIYERWGLPQPDAGPPPQLPESTTWETHSLIEQGTAPPPTPTGPDDETPADPEERAEPLGEEVTAWDRAAAITTSSSLGEVGDLDWLGASDPADEPGLREWRRVAPIGAGALLSLGIVLAAALGIGGGNDIGPGEAQELAGRRGTGDGERSVIATLPPETGGIEVEALSEVNAPTTAAATRSSGEKAAPRHDPGASPVTDPAPPGEPPPPSTTEPPTTTTEPPTTTTEPPTTTTEPPTTTTEPPTTTTGHGPPKT